MNRIVTVFLAALILGSCVSAPGTASAQSAPATAPAPGGAEAEVQALVAKAAESLDANRLAEAMRFYVSALGRAAKAGLRSRATEIEARLKELGGRLTVEPHESWLAADGSQLSGNTRELAKGAGLMPSLYLYESYGFAKSPVPDASIRFQFIANDGSLNASVSTDSRGMANTAVASVLAPGKDAVIRAYPVFSADGYTWELKDTFRDFSYLAPPNIALVAALERTPSGDSENPRVLDAVAGSLSPLGVQAVPLNGTVASARFMSAFNGDPAALAALAPSVKPGYYALVLVEVGAPVQTVYAGKVYNIFTATGKATFRIVRGDGTIVHSEVKDGIKGQAGTAADAMADCFVKIREALTSAIGDKAEQIRSAFAQ